MIIPEYLQAHGLKLREFAARIGVSYETARRYAKGTRIPERTIMARIVKETDGAVTALDFY